MGPTLGRWLAAVGLGTGALLIALTAGLIPSAAPEPVKLVRTLGPASAPKPAAPTERSMPTLTAFELCDLPAHDARIEPGPFSEGARTFFVWCRGGYALFQLDADRAPPVVTRLADLPTSMPHPGGAWRDDVSADGVPDLVVGVAPDEGLIHAAGSGVFVARGRAQGGYEPASALLEMPVVAVAALRSGDVQGPYDLFVLTRGDSAARRQGELTWFSGGPTLTKRRVFPAGFWPRDLRVVELPGRPAPQLLMAASEPGRLIRVDPLAEGEAPPDLALPGVSQLCRNQERRHVLARAARDLWRVSAGPGGTAALEVWMRDVDAGRCAVGDLDADGQLDALAVTAGGLAWLRSGGEAGIQELDVKPGYRVVDVAFGPGGAAQVLVLLAHAESAKLLVALGAGRPWPRGGRLDFRVDPVRRAADVAEIPLE